MKYGTAYYPDYFPESDWSQDLDLMGACGVTTVRILEFGWCFYEPTPESFTWDALDRFLDLCLTRNMAVCLSTPTATPPPWFFQRFPDARIVDADGRPCYSHRHMACWNHPAARAHAFATIERLAARYGNHPAVWGWQIDNEPNYAEDPSGFYDFNPNTLRDGQDWLRERYCTLDALNSAWFNAFWSQCYNEWEQIWVTHRPHVNPGSMLDFLRWREHNIAEFVQAQAALLRRCTTGQKIGVNIPEVGIPFSTAIGQDYWAQAAGLDWVGTDLYTGSPDREADIAAMRFSTDLMRSVRDASAPTAEFLISETQGGPHLRSWSSGFASHPWDPSFLVDSVQTYAQRGAEQTWFFMWRPTPGGQEIGMNATTDMDGGESEYVRTIRMLSSRTDDLFEAKQEYAKRPLALVHYSRDTIRFLNFFKDLETVSRCMLGTHIWLDRLGYRIQFIADAAMEFPLPAATLLVLPESHLLSDPAQQRLVEWVENHPEGQLHLGPHTGLLDERGQWRSPQKLPLLTWLNLRPGNWFDRSVVGQHHGLPVSAYREFAGGPEVEVLEYLHSSGRRVPALLKPRPNVFLYTYRWCEHLATGTGTLAIPTTSS